jgi:hypothetical protein
MTEVTHDHETFRELTVAEIDEVSGGGIGIGFNIAVVPQINIAVLSKAIQTNIANVGQWVKVSL